MSRKVNPTPLLILLFVILLPLLLLLYFTITDYPVSDGSRDALKSRRRRILHLQTPSTMLVLNAAMPFVSPVTGSIARTVT
jgi:hypothetical protein